jgi:putative transposase
MPRRARLDAPGTLQHVIVRGIEKRRIVDDDQDRSDFVERLGQLSKEMRTPVYAWALMPDHAHLLLRSGPQGLSALMRKLLTGYAVRYNKRHQRRGHLFQNRYKSIVVEEERYFRELVRYIHLNPLRAGIVHGLSDLEKYPWCGHGAIMGQRANSWQDTGHVLKWFDTKAHQARRTYQSFVAQGVELGRQQHLGGGGRGASIDVWTEAKALRRLGAQENSDNRILGSSTFVDQVLQQVALSSRYRSANLDRRRIAAQLIETACAENGICAQSLSGGSRRRDVSRLRHELALKLTGEGGLSFAEAARLLGVSTSAIAKIIVRNNTADIYNDNDLTAVDKIAVLN